MSIYNETKREKGPHAFNGLKENRLFERDNFRRSSRSRALRHGRSTIPRKDVYRGPQGQHSQEQYQHLNMQHRQLGFSWAVSRCFVTVNKDTLLLWWTTREIPRIITILKLLCTILRFFMILFFIMNIKLKQLGAMLGFPLQSLNPLY